MLELFQTDRMCFEDISDILAKSDTGKMIALTAEASTSISMGLTTMGIGSTTATMAMERKCGRTGLSSRESTATERSTAEVNSSGPTGAPSRVTS